MDGSPSTYGIAAVSGREASREVCTAALAPTVVRRRSWGAIKFHPYSGGRPMTTEDLEAFATKDELLASERRAREPRRHTAVRRDQRPVGSTDRPIRQHRGTIQLHRREIQVRRWAIQSHRGALQPHRREIQAKRRAVQYPGGEIAPPRGQAEQDGPADAGGRVLHQQSVQAP